MKLLSSIRIFGVLQRIVVDTKILKRRARLDKAEIDVEFRVFDRVTNKGIRFAPVSIFLNGVFLLRGFTGEDGKIRKTITLSESGNIRITGIFIEKTEFEEIGFEDLVISAPQGSVDLEVRTLEVKTTNEDRKELLDIPVRVSPLDTDVLKEPILIRNRQKLFVPLIQSERFRIDFPIESADGEFGLFQLEDRIEINLTDNLQVSGKYMPFKRLVFLSELCPTEIRGPVISRLRRESITTLKALKNSILELDAFGPPEDLIVGQIFGNGWIIEGREILRTLIDLELFGDTNVEPICFKLIKIPPPPSFYLSWDRSKFISIVVKGTYSFCVISFRPAFGQMGVIIRDDFGRQLFKKTIKKDSVSSGCGTFSFSDRIFIRDQIPEFINFITISVFVTGLDIRNSSLELEIFDIDVPFETERIPTKIKIEGTSSGLISLEKLIEGQEELRIVRITA